MTLTVLMVEPDPGEALDSVPVLRILEKAQQAFTIDLHRLGAGRTPRQSSYDIVIVPGGAGARSTYPDEPALSLLDQHVRADKQTYTICSGAFLLAGRGLLKARTVAGHTEKAAALAELGGCTVVQGLVRDRALTSVGGRAVGHVKAIAMGLQIVGDHVPENLPALCARLDLDLAALPSIQVVG